jgi:arylsulfatase A-like enzyme
MRRREFLGLVGSSLAATAGSGYATGQATAEQKNGARPNIFFAIADDWGVHAGVYGDPVVKTPVFDQLAKDGIVFENAYVSTPSCTPSRATILTGQWHWRLGTGANLYGSIPAENPVYPDLLEEAGYFVGYSRKGWGPGNLEDRPRNPAGDEFEDFAAFLKKRPKDMPFCFWFGTEDPHRDFEEGSGMRGGIPLDKIALPACFPDSPAVRGDVADYLLEVQRFDRETALVVMTSDHGMPFPRCKSNIYDDGVRVPLAIHWPGHYEGGHRITDFVSTTDFAPTFLEAAGLEVPEVMTGRVLDPLLRAGKSGRIDASRGHILFGKERHVPAQEAPSSGGYPCRGLRDDRYLLVRNFAPDRWPAGTPDYKNAFIEDAWYADCDNGPTKDYIIDNRDRDAAHRRFYALAFGKRPEFELFDLGKDPGQLNNVADDPEYADVLARMSKQLNEELAATGDPRVTSGGEKFDAFEYIGGAPAFPG